MAAAAYLALGNEDQRLDERLCVQRRSCLQQARAVGGATRSKHLNGAAFDIAMTNHDPVEFEAAAREEAVAGEAGAAPSSPVFTHNERRSTLTVERALVGARTPFAGLFPVTLDIDTKERPQQSVRITSACRPTEHSQLLR